MMSPETSPAALPLFYWEALGQPLSARGGLFKVGNFGDLASASIVEWLGGVQVRHAEDDFAGPRLMAIGSILHRARGGDVIWGSGLKGDAADRFDANELDIRAVRGPITYDFLKRRGAQLSRVTHLFDPGLLAPGLPAFAGAPRAAATRPYVIVPHFRELADFRRRHWFQRQAVLSVDCDLVTMMTAMCGAERVIASSLHGIIVAEALGIPVVWLAPTGGENLLKYYDYYYATERYGVAPQPDLAAALRAEPPPLPRIDAAAMAATFPHDRIASLTGAAAA